jgi:hypothetical protein
MDERLKHHLLKDAAAQLVLVKVLKSSAAAPTF